MSSLHRHIPYACSSGHFPLGAVGHVVSTCSSQESFNDLQTSPCPRLVSSVSKLDLTLPPEGDTCLARWIPNCPQLEELRVNCGGKGEEELIHMCTCTDHICIPYSRKLWIGANFCIFCMMARHMKINTTKRFAFKVIFLSNFECRQSFMWYVDRVMALYCYFQPLGAGSVPDPSGPLSAHISPAAIKDANEAVRNVSQGSSKPRAKYAKFTPEQKASIGDYASLHGNQAAIHHFLKQLGVEMKPTLWLLKLI